MRSNTLSSASQPNVDVESCSSDMLRQRIRYAHGADVVQCWHLSVWRHREALLHTFWAVFGVPVSWEVLLPHMRQQSYRTLICPPRPAPFPFARSSGRGAVLGRFAYASSLAFDHSYRSWRVAVGLDRAAGGLSHTDPDSLVDTCSSGPVAHIPWGHPEQKLTTS